MGKLKWQNTKLEPVESFKKGETDELLKYVDNNESALMSSLFNDSEEDISLTLKYGTSKMVFFENFIKKNHIFYVLFKLGELNGHLKAVGKIRYENQVIRIVMKNFSEFKSYYNAYASISESIIKKLYTSGDMSLKELAKTLDSEKTIVANALYYLVSEGFVNYYDSFSQYSLNDNGIILARELSK